VKKVTPLFILLALLFSYQASAFDIAINSNAFASPVLDAKEAYRRGNSDLVGIQVEEGLLLPGIKEKQQERVRKEHRIQPLNRRWRTLKNNDKATREFYNLKRYANRYNLTIMKLIKAEKVEQNSRYRY
jgi:hypothetical protein